MQDWRPILGPRAGCAPRSAGWVEPAPWRFFPPALLPGARPQKRLAAPTAEDTHPHKEELETALEQVTSTCLL